MNIFYFFAIQKNKIVLINFNGKGYGCNPKYIAQEILKRGLEYDVVWFVKDMNEEFPIGIRKVLIGRIKAMYEVATAKIIITNVKNDLHLLKKRGQYIIQTWHGSYSSKFLEKEAVNTLSPNYISESQKNSKQTNLFLSNSRILSKCYRESFWCDCEIMECGFPRNDMLFVKNSDEEIKRIKRTLGLNDEDKIVMYAPTFRDNGNTKAYGIDCSGVLETLEKLGGNWYLLIRMHPNVSKTKYLFDFNEKIINVSDYTDMQELLLVSDILITDYSSTVFEFSAMNKPTYIFATDIEEYQQMRGLKEDFFDMPFPICINNRELLETLNEYTVESGKDAAVQFMKIFGGVDNGTASQQVVDRIIAVIKQKVI